MRGPIFWYGGKGNMTAKLLPLFPPHVTYVEPFGGGAAMLCAKEPSLVECYNDVDLGLVGFFRVLRDPAQFAEFHRLVSLTPYARAEFDHCRETWRECADPVERAYRWYVVARMSFSGRFDAGWGSVVTESIRGRAATASKWLSAIDNLPALHARLMRVQIECADWRVILDRYNTPDTLVYADPPYVHETRQATRYDHEMSEQDHVELVETLLGIEGMAVVSGYDHSVYQPLSDAGWRRYEWQTACHAAGRTRASGMQGDGAALRMQPRIEVAWVKPWSRERLPLFAMNGKEETQCEARSSGTAGKGT